MSVVWTAHVHVCVLTDCERRCPTGVWRRRRGVRRGPPHLHEPLDAAADVLGGDGVPHLHRHVQVRVIRSGN